MPSDYSLHRGWGRRFGLLLTVGIAALLAMGATLAVSSWLSAKEAAHAEAELEKAGDSLVAALQVAFTEVEGQTAALASLFSATGEVSAEEFDAFVTHLGTIAGTIGAGYAVQVPEGSLAAFQAQVQEADPSFEVFAIDELGRTRSVTDTGAHMVILHFASAEPAAGLKGMCLYSDQAAAATVDTALRTDDMLLTPFLRLPGDQDSDGLVAYRRVPVDADTEPALVAIPIDLGQVLAARGFGGRWHWQVTDLGDGQVIGSASPPSEAPPYIDRIQVGRRVWQVEVVRAGRAAPAQPPSQKWVVLLVGTLVSLITGATVWLTAARLRGRREERQLRASIAARDRFLASVSHELRTPLTGIVGFLEAMPESDRLSPAQQEHIAIALEQSWELKSLVEDLLAGTRSDGELLKATPVAVDLADEVSRLLTNIPRATRDQIGAVSDGARAWANPARVRQVLRNLLDNAVKHGAPPIELGISSGADGNARVEVTDHGPGLSPEQVPYLFAPYQTMHGNPGQPDNIGLGLWLSRRLARLMGGDITYRRRDGLTVFELRLPGAPSPAEPAPAPEPGGARSPAGSPIAPGRDLSPVGSARSS